MQVIGGDVPRLGGAQGEDPMHSGSKHGEGKRAPSCAFSRALVLALLPGVVLACAGATLSTATASDYVPIYNPEVTISRAAGAIEIDGDLGDAGWQGAAVADNFAEHNPGDQTKPDVDTRVLIAYDDDNLYVGFLCYDDPAQVRATRCRRDNIFGDDIVFICLDTYGEAAVAYEIAANPYGIQGDLLFSTGLGEDETYDLIYSSAGRITPEGYVVEMAVPFASLRFPDADQQIWRADFWRNRPRGSRYQYSWAAYDRDETCWPCQWGTLRGISGVKPGAGLEIMPAVVGHQSSRLGEAGGFEDGRVKGDAGIGITYDVSSELTAEATFNPDFSQVESDDEQIDVNTTFALFYEERRPFFQEGSDLFTSFFNAVYTRSINDPLAAAKLTWRKGANSVALLVGTRRTLAGYDPPRGEEPVRRERRELLQHHPGQARSSASSPTWAWWPPTAASTAEDQAPSSGSTASGDSRQATP